MKVLDLFAGLKGWSQPFEDRGHEVFSVDIDTRFDVSLHADIRTLSLNDVPWRPDVVLASPPCEKFSPMTIGRNWNYDGTPKTEEARDAIRLVECTRWLLDHLDPSFYIVENPMGKLRKLSVMDGLERRTITYCQYGAPWMKPTDLWGNFPPSLTLKPMCKTGNLCHVRAPRGSRTGLQGAEFVSSNPQVAQYLAQVERQAQSTYGRTKSGHVAVGKVLGSGPRSALRAIIPYRLALVVCEAAERDVAQT